MLLSQIISKDLHLYPDGTGRYVAQCPWHDDTKPSLKIHDNKNLFKCFVCGKGGKGALAYIMLKHNMNYYEAKEFIKNNYKDYRIIESTPIVIKEDITYCLPADKFKKPSFEHYIYGFPSNIYEYRNLEGRLIGYTCRYNTENGKIVLPYNYILVNGSPEWVHKGFKSPHLPYKADLLRLYPKLPVCIVEGEKCADWGLLSTKRMIFISWVGGAEAVKYTDWSCLKNRYIILIPDHDKNSRNSDGILKSIKERPGNKAMLEIAKILENIASKIEFVKIPEEYPNKWDIADKIWRLGDLYYWIQKHKQNYYKLKL